MEKKYKKILGYFNETLDLINTFNDGAIIENIEGNFIYANKTATKITGYTNKDLINMHFKEIVHPDEYNKLKKRLFKRIKNKKVKSHYETIIINKNKKNIYIELTTSKISYKKQDLILIFFRDITQQKKEQKKLFEYRNHLEKLVKKRSNEIINTNKKLREQKHLLEHKNIALKELVEQIGIEKKEIQNKVSNEIDKLIMPVLKKLKLKSTNIEKEYIELLINNLEKIINHSDNIILKLNRNLT